MKFQEVDTVGTGLGLYTSIARDTPEDSTGGVRGPFQRVQEPVVSKELEVHECMELDLEKNGCRATHGDSAVCLIRW